MNLFEPKRGNTKSEDLSEAVITARLMFAVFCPQLNKVYLIPIDHAGKSNMSLRLVPAGNKQEKHVKWAQDYEL